MELQNDLVLKAARGEKTGRTPVWLMRQAGRILPEYRAIRNKLSGFIELVKNPELAAEVTVQPVDILGVDAAIIFSDILVVPEAMGLPYNLIEKQGPQFPDTIKSEDDLASLHVADDSSDLKYTSEAIGIAKKHLDGRVPIIGFAGAPWTIFAYMVEGHGSKTFSEARRMLYTNPALAHKLLGMITETTKAYLKSQIQAGADMVQLFDSWAGILPPSHFETFSLPYIKAICDAVNSEVPVTVFAKGAHYGFNQLAALPCNTIGLDWNTDIAEARNKIGYKKTLQGNLDPAALYGSFQQIEKTTRQMLEEFGPYRHIANLGHGVYPDTDPEKVKCFVQTVKEYSVIQSDA